MPNATTTKLDSQVVALIEEHVRRLVVIMGFTEVTLHCAHKEIVDEHTNTRDHLHITITAGDAGRLLIGVQGSHLEALQHVIRCLVRKQLEEHIYITVDVNGYNASRERTLVNLAEQAARKAHKSGSSVTLSPMDSSQRRIIHSTLSSRTDVKTESVGEDPERRVVVRPIFI